MSRTLLTVLGAAVAAVGLAACGTDADDGGNTGNAQDSGPGGSSGGDTRVVDHLLGETEIPDEPERVATLWASTMSAMVAMGEPPAGYAFNAEPVPGVDVPADFDVEQMEYLGHSQELDFERIAEFDPDVILATGVHEESYDQLSAIAPTVVLDWGGTGAWKEHLTDVAEVLGMPDAAADVEAEYQARVDEVAEAIGSPSDIEVSVVRFHAEELRLEVRNSFAGQILDDVGLARPAPQDIEVEESGFEPVSLERLPDGDGDAMFVFTIADANDDAPNLLEQARSNPLWDNLDAVQNDAVYPVDYKTWISSNYIGAHTVLDDMEEHLG